MGLLASWKGIELLAQGNALGKMMPENSPWRGKSIDIQMLLPLQGDNLFNNHYLGRCPRLIAHWAYSPLLADTKKKIKNFGL